MAGCKSDTTDVAGQPASVTVVSGSGQQTSVGTRVPVAPTVKVADASGVAVPNVLVRFAVSSGNGTVIGDSATTSAAGLASVGQWIVGTAPGINTLQVVVVGSSATASVSATAVTGASAAVRVAGQQGFVALTGTAVSPAPSVLAIDSYGNPVSGASVAFTVTNGGGSLTGATAVTDVHGIATVGAWVLGSGVGTNTLVAKLSTGPSITFTAQAVGSAPLLTAASATAQSGFLNFPVPAVPRVLVRDALGHALAGVPVTFSVAAGDATVAGPTGISDSAGIASPGDWHMGTDAASILLATTGLGGSSVTFSASAVAAPFLIDVRFLTTMTPDEHDAFVAAALRWMRIITGHLTSVPVNLPAGSCSALQPTMNETVTDVVIFAEVSPIDGINGILGSASPCATRSGSDLPVVGTMQFDSADLPSLVSTHQLVATITHEMGHVLGFGTLWSDLGLAASLGSNDPIFIGAQSLAIWPAFATALGYTGRPIPLENLFGAGTADAHWRESVFHAELMTGFIEAPGVAMPLSRMTIATMKDLGYQVDFSAADLFVGNLLAPGTVLAPSRVLAERIGKPSFRITPMGPMRAWQ